MTQTKTIKNPKTINPQEPTEGTVELSGSDPVALGVAAFALVGPGANGGEAMRGTSEDGAAPAFVLPAQRTAMRVRRHLGRWIAENVVEDAQPRA